MVGRACAVLRATLRQVDVREEVTNEQTGVSQRIEQILQSIILEQDKLNVNDALPNVVLDPSSFDIDQEFACQEGEVVVENQCGELPF